MSRTRLVSFPRRKRVVMRASQASPCTGRASTVRTDPGCAPRSARRAFLSASLALAAGLALHRRLARAATGRDATVAAMRAAHERENGVVHRYRAFGRKALQDGYLGIAYLFTAFAASEHVHAANFAKVLARLKADVPPLPKPTVRVGTTRENLISAVDDEIDSIDSFYPKLLEQLKPEGDEEAMTTVRYAWSSEQQHRDKIRQLQRWTGTFFDQVAKVIDQKTGQYYVCQLCGSTVNAVPANTCVVCKNPATSYRHIEPPA